MAKDDVDFHDTQHEWVSFDDADGDTWMFDLTFLTSNWTCVFGNGCLGVYNEPRPELQQGCCSFGSHFQDTDDVKRVKKHIRRLDESNWQYRKKAEKLDGPIYTNRAGETVTRVVDGACIFLNRPDFPGGPGCALHRGALEAGERPMDWKPGVCWQLPLRLESSSDEKGPTTYTLREWKRPDWGEGGEEFHWWCTDDPLAFKDREPVYKTLKDEIVEMVGPDAYEFVAGHIERNRGTTVMLPHPALRRKPAR
ncbi:MAG: hypothetical protein ABIQ73_18560 [Acidimicrobiales bacterium]